MGATVAGPVRHHWLTPARLGNCLRFGPREVDLDLDLDFDLDFDLELDRSGFRLRDHRGGDGEVRGSRSPPWLDHRSRCRSLRRSRRRLSPPGEHAPERFGEPHGDHRPGTPGDQRHPGVDRPGHLPGVGHDGGEVPSDLGGHVGQAEPGALLGLVEDHGDVLVGHAEPAQRRQVPAQVHQARPVGRGHGEDVVGHLESGGHDVAEAFVGVDDHPGPPGPQGVEQTGHVAGGDGVGLGRQPGGGQHAEPVRMGEQVVVEDVVEVVAVRLGGQEVDDRQLAAQPQGGRHLAELEVEVDQHHPLAGGPGQELGGVGGQKGLAAPARGR